MSNESTPYPSAPRSRCDRKKSKLILSRMGHNSWAQAVGRAVANGADDFPINGRDQRVLDPRAHFSQGGRVSITLFKVITRHIGRHTHLAHTACFLSGNGANDHLGTLARCHLDLGIPTLRAYP